MMADSMFQDCEYRYVEEDGVLHCKNKDGLETECDNCQGNVHLNCQNYNPKKICVLNGLRWELVRYLSMILVQKK